MTHGAELPFGCLNTGLIVCLPQDVLDLDGMLVEGRRIGMGTQGECQRQFSVLAINMLFCIAA